MSALRALLDNMRAILAEVDAAPAHMQDRVFDTLVNAALSDAGQTGWPTYEQPPQHYVGDHTATTLMPRVDGTYDPRGARNGG